VDTLQSVAAQTHSDIEHIIIDGGSTDETLALVQSHGTHVTCVVSEQDHGIYDAMNKGLSLATGEVVCFLNSDDFYPVTTVLERVCEAFTETTFDAVYGDLCYVKKDNYKLIVRFWRSSPFKPGLFSKGWCPPHPALFVRLAVYKRFGGFDLRFPIAADMELMARLLEVHRVRSVYIDKVLVHMRMGGTTNRSLRNIIQQNYEIWSALKLHRLTPSLPLFIGRKLLVRALQFVTRPN
jgi:glycosyltransferase involved in cell wall biosynthesis